jgi:hypothetical protein
MEIDYDGKVGILADLDPGIFFVTRDNERTICGISSVYGGKPAAILFNLGVRPDEPFPSMVMADFLGGQGLVGLKDAYFVPSLSHSALEFKSAQKDGPGCLTLTKDKIFMRVFRRDEGYLYYEVRAGSVATNRPTGIEIPRWSVKHLQRDGTALTLFEFDGPKPIP